VKQLKQLCISTPVLVLAALVTASMSSVAHADTLTNVTVQATDSVYNAGTYASIAGGTGGGTNPTGITVLAGSTLFTFSATGTITVDNGGHLNDPDGVGFATPETNYGYGSLSGIATPTTGALVGVFLGTGGPSGAAPTELNFNGAGGTSFASLSPMLDQVFFIGDGLTGDGMGATQNFYVPTGATELYLGLADTCNQSGGAPGCFYDNGGTFSAAVTQSGPTGNPAPTPEPSSLILLGTGVLGLSGVMRRKASAFLN
jgi:hypothetical protein